EMRRDRYRARALAENRHIAGIAAETCDVLAHPFQRRDLIEKAVIAGDLVRRFRAQRRMRHEAENADAVIDGDDDNALPRQRIAVIDRDRTRAELERAAIEPHHHRQLRAARRGGIDVERQTILTDLGAAQLDVRHLHRIVAELDAGARRGPGRGLLRRLPAQRANRRRRVRNTEIRHYLAAAARNRTGFGAYRGGHDVLPQSHGDWKGSYLTVIPATAGIRRD